MHIYPYNIILPLILIVLTLPSALHATTVIFDTDVSTPAGTVSIPVILENDQHNINTLQGEVSIDGPITELTILEGRSIVPIWVERPIVEGNRISFSGIIPGGLRDDGLLFIVQFKAKTGDTVTLRSNNSVFFLNDGNGTALEGDTSERKVTFTEELPETEIERDFIPPEIFTPAVGSDPSVFNGKYFIAFATQDKQSGLSHYEIQEQFFNTIDPDDWKLVRSPYVLKHQSLTHHIFVKAVDYEGNIRVVHIEPQTSFYSVVTGALVILPIALLLGLAILYRYVRKRQTSVQP